MALTLDEIQSTTQDYWYPKAYDNFYTSNVIVYRLLKGGRKVDGGEKIRVPLWHGSPIGGAFGENSTFDTTRRDQINAARFDWAYYYEPVTYGMKDMVENSGVAQEVDTIMTKLDMMQKAIRDSMADDIYGSGTSVSGEKRITGLLAMINSTTSTAYGGIAEDDLPEWAPGTISTTSESLTLQVMRTMRRNCKVGDGKGEVPTIYLTTDTLLDTYEGLLQPQLRYSDNNLVDAGFDNKLFGGKPVVSDGKCPSGYMFALNENYLEMVSHSGMNFKMEPWKQPTNQMKYTTQVLWAGNLTCKRRGAHTYHSNLS